LARSTSTLPPSSDAPCQPTSPAPTRSTPERAHQTCCQHHRRRSTTWRSAPIPGRISNDRWPGRQPGHRRPRSFRAERRVRVGEQPHIGLDAGEPAHRAHHETAQPSGQRPVNSTAKNPITQATKAATPRTATTISWGMARMIRKPTPRCRGRRPPLRPHRPRRDRRRHQPLLDRAWRVCAAAVAAHRCSREPLRRPASWVVAGGTAPRFPPKVWSQTRLLRRVPANPEAEQVSQAHDPNQRGPRNHGKMAKPAAEHDLGRSFRVDMGPDGLRVACHPPGHG
jgi:hypothetical protein